MATGPKEQLIHRGQGKIPCLFKCYRLNNFPYPSPVLPDEPGIYVFANLSRIDNMGNTVPKVLYVGCTKSFIKRVTKEHVEWHNAEKLNATHVCLYNETSEDKRIDVERDIYDSHKPPLNDKRP